MRVLWLCNIPLPDIARALDLPESRGGGWMVGLFNRIAVMEGIELVILFPIGIGNTNAIIHRASDKLTYCGFKLSRRVDRYDSKLEALFIKILGDMKPDIIHIWGTEYPHALAMVNACNSLDLLNETVIYLQGLCSKIALHYYSILPGSIIRKCTLRDVIMKDSIFQQQKRFARRGDMEINALRKARHAIGRTDFDEACLLQFNAHAKYHFCNEAIQDVFWENRWQLGNCDRHSIFASQGNYPIKGLHFLLEAMPPILEKFPGAHLFVAGYNVTKYDTIYDKIKISGYGLYIRRLISKYGLWNHVTFTGVLNERGMCERYLKSHVFVSASSIENSPNSLGEAMLLGVPPVASDVGGVKNLMRHGEDGFVYQADAPYMLAHYVCKIFGDDALASRMSKSARSHAAATHDRERNLNRLLGIYGEIARQEHE